MRFRITAALSSALLAAASSMPLSAQCLSINDGSAPALPPPSLQDRVYELVAPAPMTVIDFELFTRTENPRSEQITTVLFLESATGRPTRDPARQGRATVPDQTPRWVRANLASRISLAAGQKFFVGYLTAIETHRPEAASGTAVPVWRRQTIFSGWTRGSNDQLPMLRILCEPTAGGTRVFGTACASSGGIPSTVALDSPDIGQSVRIRGRRMTAGAPGTLFIGFDDRRLGGLRLPFDLGILQMPGCSVYTSGDVTTPFLTDSTGKTTFLLAITPDPGLVGAQLYFQHAVIDPAANAAGLAWSDALELTVGWQP